MLFLLFNLGDDRYAIDVRQIREVLPLMALRPLPQMPTGVAGLCNYHGQAVPVLDLCLMVTGLSARQLLSTRIIMIYYVDRQGRDRTLGLIVEQTTETMRCGPEDFEDAGLRQDETPYLGPVTRFRSQLVQRVTIERLLTADVRDRLFTLAEES